MNQASSKNNRTGLLIGTSSNLGYTQVRLLISNSPDLRPRYLKE